MVVERERGDNGLRELGRWRDGIERWPERAAGREEAEKKKLERTYTASRQAADGGLGQDNGGKSTEDESRLHFEGWKR